MQRAADPDFPGGETAGRHDRPADQVDDLKRAWRQRIRQARRDRATGLQRDPQAYHRDRQDMAAALAKGLWDGLGSTISAIATGSGCVALYEALPTEPPTDHLIAALRQAGVAVLLPRLLPDRDLAWRRVPPPGVPPIDGPGATDQDLGDAQLVLVPALAVDHLGGRLGQGGGSYDRVLPRVRPGIPVVAVVFDEELVERPVPTASHDARVTAVLTPRSGLRWLPAALPGTRE